MKLGCRSFETTDAFQTFSPPATAFRTENHLGSYPPPTSTLYVPREVPATHLRAHRGRSAALPALKQAALSQETGYLLYIELRSAIEALGGTAPKRKFTEGDPEYDSLRLLQDKD